MATYYNKEDSSKNGFVLIGLIFLFVVLMFLFIFLLNKFAFSSKNIEAVESGYELSFVNDTEYQKNISVNENKTESLTQTNEDTTKTVETKPIEKESIDNKDKIESEKTNNTSVKENNNVKSSVSENIQIKENVDLNVINSYNIQKYHSALLKQFPSNKIVKYKVRWGDTLWKIALRFGTSSHSIYVLNALDNPNVIIAGNYIKVSKNFSIKKEKTASIITEMKNQNAMIEKYTNKNVTKLIENTSNDIILCKKNNESQLFHIYYTKIVNDLISKINYLGNSFNTLCRDIYSLHSSRLI